VQKFIYALLDPAKKRFNVVKAEAAAHYSGRGAPLVSRVRPAPTPKVFEKKPSRRGETSTQTLVAIGKSQITGIAAAAQQGCVKAV